MKRGLDWYKRDPRAFLDGIQGMGPDLIGAYAVLLDLMYARGGDTLRDDHHLAGVMGCSKRKAKALTDELIRRGKITVEGDQITSSDFEQANIGFGRPPLPRWLRDEVFERDGYECRYCQTDEGPFEIDHVVPVARGGTDDLLNLVVACFACNRSKAAKNLGEWLNG